MSRGDELAGRTVIIPETREVELFAKMLDDLGAKVVRCPLIAIVDAEDNERVEAWLGSLAAGEFDDLILLTGEGLRRLLGFAERAGRSAAVKSAIAQVRTIVRGPKPAKALREIGLSPTLSAESPTTAGVIATLKNLDLTGRRIGVQLYGEDPNIELMSFLFSAGAIASPVAPYRYAPKSDDEKVVATIHLLAAGSADAIAFTSKPQVDRLFDVADQLNLREELLSGLSKTFKACVGPVVADRLREKGVEVDAMPERSFFLRPLANELVRMLGQKK